MVKRYTCGPTGDECCFHCEPVKEDPDGDYVKAEDYDALRAKLDALKADVRDVLGGMAVSVFYMHR